MSKGLLALENIIETFYDKDSEDIQIVRKELRALEIIKKYISIKVISGDLFDYYIDDVQYVSTSSQNVMSKEEYDLLKEVIQ